MSGVSDSRYGRFRESDLRVDFYDNASPGDVYRVRCRLTHTPTGIVAQSDEHTSRLLATRQAVERLSAGVLETHP